MVSTLVQKSTVRKRIGLKVKKKLTKSLLSPSSIVLYVSNICYVVCPVREVIMHLDMQT